MPGKRLAHKYSDVSTPLGAEGDSSPKESDLKDSRVFNLAILLVRALCVGTAIVAVAIDRKVFTATVGVSALAFAVTFWVKRVIRRQ